MVGALRLGHRAGADPAVAEPGGHRLCAAAGRRRPPLHAGRRRAPCRPRRWRARSMCRTAASITSGRRPIRRAARPRRYLVRNDGHAGLSGRPGHQRPREGPPGRHHGDQVRRAQGDPDELHHQGHPQPPAALGAGAAGRDDRRGAGDVRHPVAGLRGRRLSADLVLPADLHRRRGALAGGPPQPRSIARMPRP